MLRLHHLAYSRSFRILWALEELELTYVLENYARMPDMSAPRKLRDIHPLGKAPILEDGTHVLAESAVILDYLQSKYDMDGRFKPQDITQHHYWMHFAEGSLMPYLVFSLVMQQLGKKPIPPGVRMLTGLVGKQVFRQFMKPRLQEQVVFIEQHLSRHQYFAGTFSFADVQMTFALLGLLEIPEMPAMPQIQAFVKRVQGRAAYQRAQAKSPDGGKVVM